MKGSILRRATKSGEPRWLVKYDAPPAPDGRRRQAYKQFRTEREAAKWLRAALKAIDDNTHVDNSRATVAEWLDEWLEQHRPDVTPKTHERYVQLLRHVRVHVGGTRLQALSAKQVETMYAKLQAGSLSARSALHVHRVLKLAMRAAVRQRCVERDVLDDVEAPRVKARKLEVLAPEQVRALLAALRAAGHGGKPSALYVMATLAAGSGLRRGELAALRWADVDLDRGVVTVSRSVELTKAHGHRIKDPKSISGNRAVALPQSVTATLRAERNRQRELWLALGRRLTDDALIFGSPDDPMRPRYVSALSRQFADTARRLGFPGVGLHSLRHAHASMLIGARTSMKVVQERLGHSDVRTTMAIYVHSLPGEDNEAAALTGRLLGDALDG